MHRGRGRRIGRVAYPAAVAALLLTVAASPAAPSSEALPGGRILVHADTAALGRGATAGVVTSATASAPRPTGDKRVAVILLNFAGDSRQPYTTAYARAVAFTNPDSVAAYYDELSWGKLRLGGDVFGWYTIDDSATSCAYERWAASADHAASAAGVDLSRFDYRVYAFPSVAACRWSGLAYLPGDHAWLNGTGAMTLRAMAHELGHNFGTHHAGAMSCARNGVRVALSSHCTATEYGDPFTVMGSGATRQQTTVARGNFGWLSPANTRDVRRSGTYAVAPAEQHEANAVQALRIVRGHGTYLTLELRRPYGDHFDNFAASDPVVEGVTIRVTHRYSTAAPSELVDATPSTATYADAALAPGRALRDPVSRATISVRSISSAGAVVAIRFSRR